MILNLLLDVTTSKNLHQVDDTNSRVNIWAFNYKDNITPLADAVRNCHLQVVEKLINHVLEDGTDESYKQLKKMMELKTTNGKNVYDLAVETKNQGMIELLQSKCRFDVIQNITEEKVSTEVTTNENVENQLLASRSRIFLANPQQNTQENNISNETDDRLKYWTLCAIQLYKYIAVYRLHAAKLIMKQLVPLKNSVEKCSPPSFSEMNEIEQRSYSDSGEGNIIFSDRIEKRVERSALTEYPYVRSPQVVAQDIRTFWSLCKKRGLNLAIDNIK